MEDTYLGDGVYASFDGYQVWLDLRAQDHFPMAPSGYPGIALEGVVLGALNGLRRGHQGQRSERQGKRGAVMGACGCKAEKDKTVGHIYVDFCSLHKAAPELLEACRLALDDAVHYAPVAIERKVAPVLRAAIAKAEGKAVPCKGQSKASGTHVWDAGMCVKCGAVSDD
jgi:hypothetical protein